MIATIIFIRTQSATVAIWTVPIQFRWHYLATWMSTWKIPLRRPILLSLLVQVVRILHLQQLQSSNEHKVKLFHIMRSEGGRRQADRKLHSFSFVVTSIKWFTANYFRIQEIGRLSNRWNRQCCISFFRTDSNGGRSLQTSLHPQSCMWLLCESTHGLLPWRFWGCQSIA